MYKDFKQSESLDTGFVGGSGIIWMFSGIVLGLLVGLGMYYFTNNDSSALSMVSTVQNKIKQVQQRASIKPLASDKTLVSYKQKKALEAVKERKTKFSYYAVLPTIDVPTGSAKPIDTSLQATARKSQQVEKAAPVAEVLDVAPVEVVKQERNIEKDGDYLLQVASYKKKSRANLTRGRLTKKGINAYIQEKKIKGRTWYRVVAGPVDQSGITSWKNSAEKMGHRPMVISLR